MKKLVLAAMLAVAPLSIAMAGEGDKGAAGSAQTAPIPDWDKRVAGQGLSK